MQVVLDLRKAKLNGQYSKEEGRGRVLLRQFFAKLAISFFSRKKPMTDDFE